MSPTPQHHLIDVRTPSEFSTGHLTSDIAPTLNIEYQSISQLASMIHAARGITVGKNDLITLYCRSGRRSGIALKRLQGLGYECVRDIGGLEEARRVLDREMVGRQLDEEMEIGGLKEGQNGDGDGDGGGIGVRGERGGGKGDERMKKSFGKLVEGLRELEG
ncbi:hypothetical protein NX059_008854 [Plenodomus lindquistii]|nr:hypothetical protein NX059_008854 [Plenodomus lindquistii]